MRKQNLFNRLSEELIVIYCKSNDELIKLDEYFKNWNVTIVRTNSYSRAYNDNFCHEIYFDEMQNDYVRYEATFYFFATNGYDIWSFETFMKEYNKED